MDYNERLKSYIEEINSALDACLPEDKSEKGLVVDAMRYSLLSGGKRIRGVLVLEFCRICGGDVKNAVPLACAIEMVHCYSLIHDDLPCMDDDDMRRGKPSCHKKFGEAVAVLAGDALLTKAFEIAATANIGAAKAVEILAANAGHNGMVGGQILDILNENKPIDEATLNKINELKTSALIKASCLMGCVAAGADSKILPLAEEFAQKIGLSFQIVDDILDIIGDKNQLGKPTGSDAENGKTTYAALFGIKKSKEIVQKLTNEAISTAQKLPNSDEFIENFAGSLAKRIN